MGVTNINHLLMVLGVSKNMSEAHRKTVTNLMIKGFNDCCTEANTLITGGQSIMS